MAKPVITSAAPGATRLSADTLALAEGYVEVRSIGPIPVKVLAQLVEAYELTGAGTARTLRALFAAHPELLTPLLRSVHRVIAGFLLKQAGLK